ncbi:nitronate monooxygenase [Pseudarthrobacter sp. NamE5]|uniref:nitronate monooxygenase n=1 Tax=Pseudarthrobacter sp. NamE5 TaxID=2576839 RepID=UPI00110BF1D1|nr:nitronate monooxygenase [Pseudarthrobacter sp. NamE5]TLM81804.1 nitronate monooxygenase [Pseudarthrobacter sp. NamE5]
MPGSRPLFNLSTLALPVIQAPMAGGPSTPRLAAAVSSAGGLGFLAAGYKSAAVMQAEIEATRELTGAAFGVNVFVPQPSVIGPGDMEQYALSLAPDAGRFGVELGEPRHDDDDWDHKVDVLLQKAPAVVSFTFDLPDPAVITALQQRGVYVVATVTSMPEAVRALETGVDALCAQGPEAGGHRGTFHAAGPAPEVPLHAILEELSKLGAPLIAAGGIVTAEDTRAALSRGAAAVQAGTAFLLADEAGTKAAHRTAMASRRFTGTAVTRAFSGRNARGLHNEFMRRHDADAPYGYPEIHHLTTPLRAAAAAAGDPDWLNLWAGTGFQRTTAGPAPQILAALKP